MTNNRRLVSQFLQRVSVFAPAVCSFVLGGLLLSSPALADDAGKPLKGWRTGVMSQADGSFAYCVTEAEYKDGLWVIFALNPQGEVNIGLGDRSAKLPVGMSRDIAVSVDGKSFTLPGQVAKPELLVMNASSRPELYSLLIKGSKLVVDGDSFSLAGSAKAMTELKECVLVSSGKKELPALAQNAVQPPVAPPAPVAENKPLADMSAGDGATSSALASAAQQVADASSNQSAPAGRAGETPSVESLPVVQFDSAVVARPGERDAAAPPPDFSDAVDRSVAVAVQSEDSGEQDQAAVAVAESVAPVASSGRGGAGFVAAEAKVEAQVSVPVEKGLPAPLGALLAKAGLDEIKAVAADSQTGEVYAWKGKVGFSFLADSVRGAVREAAVASGGDIEKMARNHLLYLNKACSSGDFSSQMGAVQKQDSLQVATAETKCKVDGDTLYSRQVFTLAQSGGGQDVLSVITHTQKGGHSGVDQVQSALVDVLLGRRR